MRFLNKGLILAAVVFGVIIAAPTLALAEGYNDPLETTNTVEHPQGPHGGYTTTSNKCKECHAVHLATGIYSLTRANSRSETCDFCHGIGGAALSTVVLDEKGHGLSSAQESSGRVTAPDDNIPAYNIESGRWGCLECHSVHDAYGQTVKLAGFTTTKLLKRDPNPGKTYLYYNTALVNVETRETTQTLSHWCSTCHNANFGLHTEGKQVKIGETTQTVYGHDSSGSGYTTTGDGYANVNPGDGTNNGPTCKQCHPSDGRTGSSEFPHSSGTTPAMLKAGSSSTGLDKVCSSCHNTTSLP